MIDRRLTLVVILALGLLGAPAAASGQQKGNAFRVGFIGMTNPELARQPLEALRQGLREHGWIEGQNIVIEYRWAGGKPGRLPELAADLVYLKVDLIVVGTAAAIPVVKDATRTIPIVMAGGGDPVAEGFAASLARPGGNITGLTFVSGPEIGGKLLELLTQSVPRASRLALLSNPANPPHAAIVKETLRAAEHLGIPLHLWQARNPEEIDIAFAAMTKERISGVLVLPDAMFAGQRGRLANLAARNRLPAIYGQAEHVSAGGLMSYGPSNPDNFRRVASFVDRILKGANPATLPIERPTMLELVINLNTARELGIKIPPSLLQRADRIVE